MKNICRICFIKEDIISNNLISIFTECQLNLTVCDKIMKCSSIRIDIDEKFTSICKTCNDNLNIAYDFKQKCEESIEILNNYITSDESTKDESQTDKTLDICNFNNENITEKCELTIDLNVEDVHKDCVDDNKLDSNKQINNSNELVKDMDSKNKSKRSKLVKKSKNICSNVEKSHICDKCGNLYKKVSSLTNHQRRHTGEKPYMCSTCGKLFHVANELTKHSMVHLEDKRYKCMYCGKGFCDWGSRFKHERCHRGERPYKCDVCMKKFSYSYVLKRHMMVHSEMKPLE